MASPERYSTVEMSYFMPEKVASGEEVHVVLLVRGTSKVPLKVIIMFMQYIVLCFVFEKILNFLKQFSSKV